MTLTKSATAPPIAQAVEPAVEPVNPIAAPTAIAPPPTPVQPGLPPLKLLATVDGQLYAKINWVAALPRMVALATRLQIVPATGALVAFAPPIA